MKRSRYLLIAGVVVAIAFGSALLNQRLANNPPQIISLSSESAEWSSWGSHQIVCSAIDTDGDQISYRWTSSGGTIVGAGATAWWTAPGDPGEYDITVMVTDARGGSDTRTLTLVVMPEQTQHIERLAITKDRYGHCYLREYSRGYYVGRQQKYDIECIVAVTSNTLHYIWTATGGDLSGEGPMITWTAPSTSGEVTITVEVLDAAGNSVSRDLILHVVACSTCTFGYCR